MKKLINLILFIILLIIYLIFGDKYHFLIGCPIKLITGFYCPGCGVTRMLIAILKLDFYQAFRYNPLVFILLPIITFLYLENLVSVAKHRIALYKKINNKYYIVLIIILLVYSILRNIYPIFAPTVI